MPISQADYEAKHKRQRRTDSETDAALRKIAGMRYRIARAEDGQLQIPLRGDKGDIYMHGPDVVGAYIKSRKPNASFNAIKRRCPAATIHVEGDHEIIALHPVDGCREFVAACGGKTRRQMSVEQREKAAEALRHVRRTPPIGGA